MTKPTLDKRKKQIQLIHIAKNKLNLDDDTYRDILLSTTGKESTKEMNSTELENVLTRLKRLGFNIEVKKKAGADELATNAQCKLIRHLWLSLHEAGQVRNSSEQALIKFVQRHIPSATTLEQLSKYYAGNIIEHLKKWCKRAGIQH